jgi:hypothetical protein
MKIKDGRRHPRKRHMSWEGGLTFLDVREIDGSVRQPGSFPTAIHFVAAGAEDPVEHARIGAMR